MFISHQLGDYGTIDYETGEFIKRGNIYTDKAIIAENPVLNTPEGRPRNGKEDKEMVICAGCTEVKRVAVGGSV